jgi:hypothetical protein
MKVENPRLEITRRQILVIKTKGLKSTPAGIFQTQDSRIIVPVSLSARSC